MAILDMRRTDDRAYKIKSLNGRRHLILRLHHQGLNNKQISARLQAEGISCTPQNVSDIINSPLGQQKLLNLGIEADKQCIEAERSVSQRITEVLPAAMRNIEEAVKNHTVGDKAVPLREVLGLSRYLLQVKGHSPVQRLTGHVEHDHVVTTDVLKEIKQVSQEADRREDSRRRVTEEVYEADFEVEEDGE